MLDDEDTAIEQEFQQWYLADLKHGKAPADSGDEPQDAAGMLNPADTSTIALTRLSSVSKAKQPAGNRKEQQSQDDEESQAMAEEWLGTAGAKTAPIKLQRLDSQGLVKGKSSPY